MSQAIQKFLSTYGRKTFLGCHHYQYHLRNSYLYCSSFSTRLTQQQSLFFTTTTTTTSSSTSSNNKKQEKTTSTKSSSKKPKKENFAKKYFDPAFRGELNKHHTTGIPKLAIRKSKGHETKDDFPRKDLVDDDLNATSVISNAGGDIIIGDGAIEGGEYEAGYEEEIDGDEVGSVRGVEDGGGSGERGGKKNKMKAAMTSLQMQRGTGRNTGRGTGRGADRSNNKPKTILHPRKEDLTHLFQGPKPEDLDPLHTAFDVSYIGKGGVLITPDSATSRGDAGNGGIGGKKSLFQQQRNLQQQQQQQQQQDEGSIFKRGQGRRGSSGDQIDIWGDEIDQEELEDPWITPYISTTKKFVHDESRREAKPIVHPTNRLNPTKEFIEKYNAFAYVTNVPRPVFHKDGKEAEGANTEEELGIFKNPLHRHQVAEIVANAMNVPVVDVFPANMTSAFVGFQDARIASDVYNRSESKRVILKDIQYKLFSELNDNEKKQSIYNANGGYYGDVQKFISSVSSPDCIIQLSNLPAGMKPGTIVRLLHKITQLNKDDVQFVSPTKVLLKRNSSNDAKELLNNESFHVLIKTLSRQILRVQPAKLEVVHDKFDGPARQFQYKKTTDKLVVDGDVPTHNFFISHASVLHLCNVQPSVTKQEISNYFQQFCVRRRDVEGSIEIVKSIDGHPTGRVYVGFDLASEGDRAWEALCNDGQKIILNSAEPPIRVRPVKERPLLRGQKLGERSERTEEELLASLQSSWQDHVDPKDIELLESFGVSRDVLEDAFLSARYNNPSFGVEDLARKGERLHEHKIPGQEYNDFVKLYIETLIECGATRENPGAMFEGMFLPGEEIDYSLFDEEEERLSKLREEREKLV